MYAEVTILTHHQNFQRCGNGPENWIFPALAVVGAVVFGAEPTHVERPRIVVVMCFGRLEAADFTPAPDERPGLQGLGHSEVRAAAKHVARKFSALRVEAAIASGFGGRRRPRHALSADPGAVGSVDRPHVDFRFGRHPFFRAAAALASDRWAPISSPGPTTQ